MSELKGRGGPGRGQGRKPGSKSTVKKTASELKNHRFAGARWTKEEIEAIETAVSKSGLSKSEFIRIAILNGIKGIHSAGK